MRKESQETGSKVRRRTEQRGRQSKERGIEREKQREVRKGGEMR